VEFGTSSSEEFDAPVFLDSSFVLKQLLKKKWGVQKLLHLDPIYDTEE
jgi:hypothetical protein